MLPLLPTAIPPLSILLDDLGNPPPATVAKALDVSVRTVQRWQAADQAPRMAALALFWVTRWGQSQVDCRTFNDARLQAALAAMRERQNVALRVELARVLRLGRFDCANDVSDLADGYLREVPVTPRAPRPTAA